MLNVGQDRVLRDHVVHLSQLDNVGLLESLHCEELARLLVPGEHHATEGTYREGIQNQ